MNSVKDNAKGVLIAAWFLVAFGVCNAVYWIVETHVLSRQVELGQLIGFVAIIMTGLWGMIVGKALRRIEERLQGIEQRLPLSSREKS